MRDIPIEASDGCRSVATLFRDPASADDAPVVVCFAAMGVRASYYRPFAEALCRTGYDVATVDLRGLGSSSVRAGWQCDFGYREVVELDFPAAIATVRRTLPDRPIYALGHSLGGQLACLYAAAHPGEVKGIVLVASCSVYYRNWTFPHSGFVFGFAQSANLLAKVWGFFPGYLVKFGDREARRLVRDWSFQGRTGRYQVDGSSHDYEALLRGSRHPILALSFTDDTYCPEAAVAHLLAKMPEAPISHLHLSPKELGRSSVGHFGWVKRSDGVVPRIGQWLQSEPGHTARARA
ncbi:MAG: alpha/beta fold hydrolase [Acidobacteriota bacterium]